MQEAQSVKKQHIYSMFRKKAKETNITDKNIYNDPFLPEWPFRRQTEKVGDTLSNAAVLVCSACSSRELILMFSC